MRAFLKCTPPDAMMDSMQARKQNFMSRQSAHPCSYHHDVELFPFNTTRHFLDKGRKKKMHSLTFFFGRRGRFIINKNVFTHPLGRRGRFTRSLKRKWINPHTKRKILDSIGLPGVVRQDPPHRQKQKCRDCARCQQLKPKNKSCARSGFIVLPPLHAHAQIFFLIMMFHEQSPAPTNNDLECCYGDT